MVLANTDDNYSGSEVTSLDSIVVDWIAKLLPDSEESADALRCVIAENPGRISRAYRELLNGYLKSPEELVKSVCELPHEPYEGLVSATQVPFCSFCAHHFLPFHGTIDVVYQPGDYIIGIGKMPRLVECRARRFQMQELLVKEICEDMMEHARADGVYVRSVARHMCLCYRGPTMQMTTNAASYSMGSLTKDTGESRALTFLQLSCVSS